MHKQKLSDAESYSEKDTEKEKEKLTEKGQVQQELEDLQDSIQE